MFSYLFSKITCGQFTGEEKQLELGQFLMNCPSEMFFEIFSFMNGTELTHISLVNKSWYHKVATNEMLWSGVVNQYAFGAKKWKQHFGDVGNDALFPKDILKILKSPCPLYQRYQTGQTHKLIWIPKTINNEPLTLNSFGNIIKEKYNLTNKNGFIHHEILREYGDRALEKSGWVLMLKYPMAVSKGWSQQHWLTNELHNYEAPRILEAKIGMYADCAYSIREPATFFRKWFVNPYSCSYKAKTCCIEKVKNQCAPIVIYFYKSDALHDFIIKPMAQNNLFDLEGNYLRFAAIRHLEK